MKITFAFIVYIIACSFTIAFAQQSTSVKWVLEPQIQAIHGNSSTSVALSLATGFQKNNHRITVGLGVDNYQFRTAPLFTTYKHYLSSSLHKPFVFATAGYSVAWLTENQKAVHYRWNIWNPISIKSVYNNGYMYALGVGYKVQLKKHQSISFTMAFDVKNIKELYNEDVYTGNSVETTERSNEYIFRRLAFGCIFSLD
ncbi:MAG: hypothetical protein ACOVNY_02030 [Chitinophagaceae bacterium]